MDGSAKPFIEGIDEVGLTHQNENQRVFQISEKAEYVEGKRYDPVCLGANTKTAVVIVKDKAINKGGLRMKDELIFHRALDMVGDLMLSGGIIQGRISANSPAHRLNHGLLKTIFDEGKYNEIGVKSGG
ncbi:UDP-3-O-acyl-N-acetylglucosamine deacetylase [Nymphon striatum]|nr:UDP-3-O-acyl-N-acetylglucosamine deacetylase [Nymphon striatum]